MRLLIAEDDAALRGLLVRAMRAEGFEVEEAPDGFSALALAGQQAPDLLLLDFQMPGMTGLEVLEALRAGGARFPVLMLTAESDMDTRVSCLDSGADDFLTKPFALRELRARCRALLRRAGGAMPAAALEAPALVWGALRLDRVRRTATGGAEAVTLTGRECRLLEELIAAGGRAVSRGELLRSIWGRAETKANLVDVYVSSLRRKLEGTRAEGEGARAGFRGLHRQQPWIEAVRGEGYRMSAWLAAPPRELATRGAEA